MPITVSYEVTIPVSSANNAENLKAIATNLIPSPLPADFRIHVEAPFSVHFTWTSTPATPDQAAQQIYNVLHNLKP